MSHEHNHPHEDARDEGLGEGLDPLRPVDPVEAAQAAADALEPRRRLKRRTRQMVTGAEASRRRPTFTQEQRLLVLDAWVRSGLTGKQMAGLVGLSPATLHNWKRRFEEQGPAGLADRPRGRKKGSRLPDHVKRAVLLLKRQHPDWGSERISDVLRRAEGYGASPGAIVRLLKSEGYEVVESPTRPHPQRVRRFERSRVNELWQSDLFTFTLKRSGRRLHLVAFLDDRSRFVVGHGVSASASNKMVLEAFESALVNFGAPTEVLTDQGPQYHTWRGKSAFRKLLERRGIAHVLARPRHPQTVGKTERFWGTLWRECLEGAVCRDLEDARERIAHFIGYYNFQRPHRALDGLVPADRFFGAEEQVKAALSQRVAGNALELAREGRRAAPLYLTGKVDGREVSVSREGERVVVREEGAVRGELDLEAAAREADAAEAAPGTSAFDGLLRRLGRALGRADEGGGSGEENVAERRDDEGDAEAQR